MKNLIAFSSFAAVAAVFFLLGAITPNSALKLEVHDDAAIGAQFVETIVVEDLQDGFPADSAGLQKGDILRRVNGELIESIPHLMSVMKKIEPGESMTLSVSRFKIEDDRWEGLTFEIATVPYDWPDPR